MIKGEFKEVEHPLVEMGKMKLLYASLEGQWTLKLRMEFSELILCRGVRSLRDVKQLAVDIEREGCEALNHLSGRVMSWDWRKGFKQPTDEVMRQIRGLIKLKDLPSKKGKGRMRLALELVDQEDGEIKRVLGEERGESPR